MLLVFYDTIYFTSYIVPSSGNMCLFFVLSCQLDEDARQNNIVFEVIDQSDGLNPESLSVHLFTNDIPTNRLTENRAEHSVSNVYAVFKTFLSLQEMENADGSPVEVLYISVRCGPSASHFRFLGEHVLAAMLFATKSALGPGFTTISTFRVLLTHHHRFTSIW